MAAGPGAALAARRGRAERQGHRGVHALEACGHRSIARAFSRGQKRKREEEACGHELSWSGLCEKSAESSWSGEFFV